MRLSLIAQGWSTKPATGFLEVVGPIWARRDGDTWVNGFQVDHRHLNPQQHLHGGMMAAFADSVMGRVVANNLKPRACVTVQLSMHYLAAVKMGDFVTGRCEIVRTTRSMVFVLGRFFVASEVVAMADGVWKILSDSKD